MTTSSLLKSFILFYFEFHQSERLEETKGTMNEFSLCSPLQQNPELSKKHCELWLYTSTQLIGFHLYQLSKSNLSSSLFLQSRSESSSFWCPIFPQCFAVWEGVLKLPPEIHPALDRPCLHFPMFVCHPLLQSRTGCTCTPDCSSLERQLIKYVKTVTKCTCIIIVFSEWICCIVLWKWKNAYVLFA